MSRMLGLSILLVLVGSLMLGAIPDTARSASCPALERVSVLPGGAAPNGESWSAQISADGRRVAFISEASDLAPGFAPARDVLWLDRDTGSLIRATHSADGLAPANLMDEESLRWISLSADGRHVAFTSDATNMVTGDAVDVHEDVFVWDQETDTIEKVTRSTTGGSAHADSEWPSISGDGRYVVFESKSTVLVPGDASDDISDVFLWDRQDGSIRKITQTPGGAPANATSRQPVISADGSAVAFITSATNLPGADPPGYVLWDTVAETFEPIAPYPVTGLGGATLAISADATRVALLSGGPLNPEDPQVDVRLWIYLWERATGTYTRVTKALEPWIDPHGSASLWFRDSDVLELPYHNVIRESLVLWTDISHTTAYVEDSDYTITEGGEFLVVTRLPSGSIPAGGTAQATFESIHYGPDGDSREPAISPDGRFIGFVSEASNLIEGDGNPPGMGPPGVQDAFVWDATTEGLEKLTWNTAQAEANDYTTTVQLSSGAAAAVIGSSAWDLVAGDIDDGLEDVFLGTPCMGVPEPSPVLLGLAMLATLRMLATAANLRAARSASMSRPWRLGSCFGS